MVENEIQFLSWHEFKQMAPPILQLEVTRLTNLIQTPGHDLDIHNALVRARFEVARFIAGLAGADRDRVETACAPHLGAALLALSFPPSAVDDAETLGYVINRIEYVYYRIAYIY
jgi:hypothetical protein